MTRKQLVRQEEGVEKGHSCTNTVANILGYLNNINICHMTVICVA